jgi:hypothetical protein
MEHRHPRNTALDQRLDDSAARLRKEERGTPRERESFIRRPRKAEDALHVEWVASPRLQPPK